MPIMDDLPQEYKQVKDDLIEKGRPWEWILKTVDPNDKYAAFLRDGKPWYRSECPNYEGYWLCGGTGSVQCKAAEKMLPGIHHVLFCGKEFGTCPYSAVVKPGSQEKFCKNKCKE